MCSIFTRILYICSAGNVHILRVLFFTSLISMLNHHPESGDPLNVCPALVAPTSVLSVKVAHCCHLVVLKVMTCLGT